MPIYLCEGGKFFYFTSCGPHAEAYNFLYARGKDSGIYWKADPDLEIHFLSADEDYFYALLEPVPEEMIRETQDPLLRQIFKQFALSLGEETSARLERSSLKEVRLEVKRLVCCWFYVNVNLLFFYCNIKYYSDLCISSLTKLLKELRSRLIIQATLAFVRVNYP